MHAPPCCASQPHTHATSGCASKPIDNHTLITPSSRPHHALITPSSHPHHTLITPSSHPHHTLITPSGLSGSVVSFMVSDLTTVGASGAIFGLLGMAVCGMCLCDIVCMYCLCDIVCALVCACIACVILFVRGCVHVLPVHVHHLLSMSAVYLYIISAYTSSVVNVHHICIHIICYLCTLLLFPYLLSPTYYPLLIIPYLLSPTYFPPPPTTQVHWQHTLCATVMCKTAVDRSSSSSSSSHSTLHWALGRTACWTIQATLQGLWQVHGWAGHWVPNIQCCGNWTYQQGAQMYQRMQRNSKWWWIATPHCSGRW